jgi:hypothetical protein
MRMRCSPRRPALALAALALVGGALPAHARPTLPGGSSGTAEASWMNDAPLSPYNSFGFNGTLSFADGSYEGRFNVGTGPAPELRLGAWDGPVVAHCSVRHTQSVEDPSGVQPGGAALGPAAAVLRCTGHLHAGPDSTTTLTAAYLSGTRDSRFGNYHWYDGTYVG